MKFTSTNLNARRRVERGSVFILVLWIAFGLVSLALYFANSMSLELRAADNRVTGLEADQAIVGAARYASNVLATLPVPGQVPDLANYKAEAVPVGNARFWFLGRGDDQDSAEVPVFGLVDEASKINLNTANSNMLMALPRMTPELAGAIIDWRDTNSDVSASGGAENDTYQRLNPARMCKNTNFESVAELRLVNGMTLEILFGEDSNMNGVLDPNENDGDLSAPSDNRDGRLDPGLFEYVTVYSREPNVRTNGKARINIRQLGSTTTGNNTGGRGGSPATTTSSTGTSKEFSALLQEKNFDSKRIQEIIRTVGNTTVGSVLEFFVVSKMTADEFAQIATDITYTTATSVNTNSYRTGLVNVNTASETVLACIVGIGTSNAPALVSYRQANPAQLDSFAWVTNVLNRAAINQAGPYLTGNSYQFTADIAAIGRLGRGFKRQKFVFETPCVLPVTPKILYRQDLTSLGWALGAQTRKNILAALNTSSP